MTLLTRDAVMIKNSVTKHNIHSVSEKIDESCNMAVWFCSSRVFLYIFSLPKIHHTDPLQLLPEYTQS